MAVRYETRYVDDIDGTELHNEEARSIEFSFDGKDYSIDLSAANADAFREAISPYLNAATKMSSGAKRKAARKSASKTSTGETKLIREWAKSNGYNLSDRGRIPADVMDAYAAAN
ncbi:hypothetical protein ABIE38_003495 [Dietzia sp. 2505]|uniref:histone-like nucleoid-structuring protein Lsr2 n=1 Tax=Dietzia sp. 2505 TaxID=3156457 RepID=UPI003390E84D